MKKTIVILLLVIPFFTQAAELTTFTAGSPAVGGADADVLQLNANTGDITSLIGRLDVLEAMPGALPGDAIPRFTSNMAQISVDCDAGGLLQDAINNAPLGSVRINATGTCAEDIFISRNDLQIFGASGSNVAITRPAIDGAQNIRFQFVDISAIDGNALTITDHGTVLLIASNITVTSSIDSLQAIAAFGSHVIAGTGTTISASSTAGDATGSLNNRFAAGTPVLIASTNFTLFQSSFDQNATAGGAFL